MASEAVVHTTLSAGAAGQYVSTLFDVPSPVRARFFSRGFNDVYEIGTPSRLFLRIGRCGRRSFDDVECEARVLAELAAAGGPVAPALRGRDGCFAQRISVPEGERIAVLFAAAPGEEAGESPEHARAQGVALARIHSLPLAESVKRGMRRLDFETLLHQPVAWMAELLEGRPTLLAQIKDVAADVQARLARNATHLSVGLCHGDCHGYNATILDDQATLFDFDEGGIGWLAYDLAVFLHMCLIAVPARRPLWSSFLGGYRSQRLLPPADLEAIQAFMIVRELWAFGAWAEGAPHWGGRWFQSPSIARRIDELVGWHHRLTGPRLEL
jgi:Ser/Thr protein kinase RdoA (MazF antagonist)